MSEKSKKEVSGSRGTQILPKGQMNVADELLLYDCGTRLCNLGVFIEVVLRGESRPPHFGDAAVVI